MTLFAQAEPSVWSSMVIAAVLCGFVVVWTTIGTRLWHGKPVLPRQPRRPVPWKGIDLLAVLVVNLVIVSAVSGLLYSCLDSRITRSPTMWDVEKSTTAHQVAQLMTEGDVWILLLCGISAVVVAPIAEEFYFRVLLQGWLEAGESRLRPFMPLLGRLGAFGPIFLRSLLFARMHFRVAGPPRNIWMIAYGLLALSIGSVISMALAIAFLRVARGATATDFGWSLRHFPRDVKLGVLAFAALALPIYGTQIALASLLPKSVPPDPFALFPLALALGILYYRTHRIVPAITLHMSLNFTSLTVAWLSLP
jgi:membrane protease YdiL (CAAX protease family)